MTAIQKISKRAKAIRKAHPSMKWQTCIDKASAEYRAGKLGRTPAKFRQTGTSDKKADKERKALPPGRRVAKKSKHVYYERRANRSDKPGRLTGTALNEMVLRNLRERNQNLAAAETKLRALKALLSVAPSKMDKKLIRVSITNMQKLIRTYKAEIRMLKTNIK